MCNSGVYSVELFSAFIVSGEGDETLYTDTWAFRHAVLSQSLLVNYHYKFIVTRIWLYLSVYCHNHIILIINNLLLLTQ